MNTRAVSNGVNLMNILRNHLNRYTKMKYLKFILFTLAINCLYMLSFAQELNFTSPDHKLIVHIDIEQAKLLVARVICKIS